jgi:hypothetical protein
MNKRETLHSILACGCLIIAGIPSNAQTQNVSDKISPAVEKAMGQETAISVFVELRKQPQRDILQRLEAESSRLILAKFAFERLAGNRAAVPEKDLDSARDELDAAITSVRHNAAQAIQDEIRPEQDHVSAMLAGAGATNIERYYIVNMLRADVPASAISTIAGLPEVMQISLIGSGAGTLNTAAGVGAPAFWYANPTGFTGKGQVVAVLDSGINEVHPAFKGVKFVDKVFLANAVSNPVCP